MIKLERSTIIPQVLNENQILWTQNLLDEIAKYGHYSNIPKDIKNKLLVHYRHQDIKEPLFMSSNDKCAFCEGKPGESGNIEVEHFAPKSLYPSQAFEWDNFLPSCRKCNDAKSIHDTVNEPIINPYVQDPREAFNYDFLEIQAIKDGPLYEEAARTITVCNLNATRLILARSSILVTLTGYVAQLKEAIEDVEKADTNKKRRNRIVKLRDSLELADRLTFPSEKYSDYCRYFLTSKEEYKKAIVLITELDTE